MSEDEGIPPRPGLDGMYPFPVPAAFVEFVDIVWRNAFREGDFLWEHLLSSYGAVSLDMVFDLSQYIDGFPETPTLTRDKGSVAYLAPPEFFPFGHRGDGTYLGWVVPAPELGRSDHPVAIAGSATEVGHVAPDTRSGLEWLLSHALRSMGDSSEDSMWDRAGCEIRDSLIAALDLRPDPDSVTGRFVLGPAEYPVPDGWRRFPTSDWTGVLAPADAFAGRDPVSHDTFKPLQPVLDDVARLLDDGYPATALVELKDAFSAGASFARLKELWQRAYRMLGRPALVEALDMMTPLYPLEPTSGFAEMGLHIGDSRRDRDEVELAREEYLRAYHLAVDANDNETAATARSRLRELPPSP